VILVSSYRYVIWGQSAFFQTQIFLDIFPGPLLPQNKYTEITESRLGPSQTER